MLYRVFILHIRAIFSAHLTPGYNHPKYFMSTEHEARLYAVFFAQHYWFGDSPFIFSFYVIMVFNETVNFWKKCSFGDG
jgi:uncharacterized membrane protein YoaT (DUF817 family)